MTQPQRRNAINWVLVFTMLTFILAISLRAGTLEEKVMETERINRAQTDEIRMMRDVLFEIRADIKLLVKQSHSPKEDGP